MEEIHAQILMFYRNMLANTVVNYVHGCTSVDAYRQIYPSYMFNNRHANHKTKIKQRT